MRRPVKGRVGIEQERLISAEEGMLFSPLHSRAYFILGTGLEGEDILKEAKQRFIKVVFNRHLLSIILVYWQGKKDTMIKKAKPNNFEEPPTDEEDDTLRSNFVFYGIDNTVFFLRFSSPELGAR